MNLSVIRNQCLYMSPNWVIKQYEETFFSVVRNITALTPIYVYLYRYDIELFHVPNSIVEDLSFVVYFYQSAQHEKLTISPEKPKVSNNDNHQCRSLPLLCVLLLRYISNFFNVFTCLISVTLSWYTFTSYRISLSWYTFTFIWYVIACKCFSLSFFLFLAAHKLGLLYMQCLKEQRLLSQTSAHTQYGQEP